MSLFGKKEEETTSCCCGGNCDAESMAKAESAKTEGASVKGAWKRMRKMQPARSGC